jgi:hypothetical protein
VPWWKAWFAGSPSRPWNAAFASLLIAGVVTLLWRGGDELPQEPGIMAPPPSAPVAAPAPAAREKASGPALANTTVPPAPPSAKPAPPPRAAAQTAGPAREREAADAVAERRDAGERQSEVAAPAAAQEPTAPAAVPAPAAPPTAAPMPARRAPVPQAATAPSYAFSFEWDTVHIAAAQREATFPREQASALTGAIADLLVARGPTADPSNPGLQITLADNGRTAAQLTLGETTFTWQLAGGPAQTWRADTARLARARADAMRLLVPR